jgi:competence protein ComEC
LGVHAGDTLRIVGQLSLPAAAQNPGEFDFARHARADRQLCRLSADSPDCVEVVDRPASWGPARLWEELRGRGDSILWRRLAHQRSGLAAALLLGIREEMDAETTQAFSKTGTIHLLSISGLHVGILAGFLFWAMRLRWAGRGAGLATIALVTLGYALLIDAEPPAVRATVVVLALCIARYWWRRLPAFNALALAALLVLIWNPAEMFRVGPQLSFLAMAALVWFGPLCVSPPSADPLHRLIERTRPWHEKLAGRAWRWSRQMTLLTACVWAASAPLVMAQFHLVSPATLVLTPLLAVPVAAGLMSGFAVLALEFLFPPLGVMGAWLCDLCLSSLEGAVEAASRCPGSHFWVPGPEPWWLWTFYAAMALGAAIPGRRLPARWCMALAAGWSAIGLIVPLVRPADECRLDCTFLSVGHGCAVVLELPDGQTLLYDAGRLGSPAAGARSVSSYLWSRGKTHLDAIVLSHADVDHYNAVPELLEKFSVGVIYATPVMLADEGPAMGRLRSAVDKAGVPLRETWAGDRLRVGGGCRLEILHPTRHGVLGSDNANSLVLLVEHEGRRILLTGDLETPGMNDVIAESALDCDVILAPHHGSQRSNPPGFAAWSTPEWVIISGSHTDKQGEAAAAYRISGARVLDTADVGAVRVTITSDQFIVEPHHSPLPSVGQEQGIRNREQTQALSSKPQSAIFLLSASYIRHQTDVVDARVGAGVKHHHHGAVRCLAIGHDDHPAVGRLMKPGDQVLPARRLLVVDENRAVALDADGDPRIVRWRVKPGVVRFSTGGTLIEACTACIDVTMKKISKKNTMSTMAVMSIRSSSCWVMWFLSLPDCRPRWPPFIVTGRRSRGKSPSLAGVKRAR